MAKQKAKTVEEILTNIDVGQKEIVEKLRGTVKNTVPTSIETVRRGRITYRVHGKDFASVRITKSHVDLLFSCGQKLPSNLMKGTGKTRDPKHVEITTIQNFDWQELNRLLKEAATLTTIT